MSSTFDHQHFLKNLSNHSGVYQMLAENEEVLYVGKAQNLKKRVASYFRADLKNPRIASLVKQIKNIKVIITHSDNEALLLENNLIKQLKPRYNVLFRDDKSYAYLYLSDDKDFPRLDFYRGPKQQNGYYYGPYSSSLAIRETLNLLQKLFKVRQCNDVFFRNRTRPCIQYQIKRCTAPCVKYVSAEDYQQQVRCVKLFLQGKNQQLLNELIKQMDYASVNLQYEEAARYRDQIASLRKVQEKQSIYSQVDNLDVIALIKKHAIVCVQVLMFRQGRLIGNRAYFPKVPTEMPDEEIVASFATQYYLSELHQEDIPKLILVNVRLHDQTWINDILSEQAKNKIQIKQPQRGDQLRLIELASMNAEEALKNHLLDKHQFFQRMEALQQSLNLAALPQRIECFDVSHLQGEATIASCVVADTQGMVKRDYRRYNITDITKGDDYAALKQVLTRRYSKIKSEEGILPDIIMIDGGKGQLQQAITVLEELQISGITLLGIAKGPGRKAGLETIFIAPQSSIKNTAAEGKISAIQMHDEALLMLQFIRDEAHRFAITGHQKHREKKRFQSHLEDIPGIGSLRRRNLLQYFGGLQEIKRASVDEIAKVSGISKPMAEKIYEYLRK
jgi:excinuclease ABC subunit C